MSQCASSILGHFSYYNASNFIHGYTPRGHVIAVWISTSPGRATRDDTSRFQNSPPGLTRIKPDRRDLSHHPWMPALSYSRLSPGRHGSNPGPTHIDRSFPTSRGVLRRQVLHLRVDRGTDAIHLYLDPSPSFPATTCTMHEVSRLLQAAAALSQRLRDSGVPHAFHGNVLTAVLSKAPLADVRLIHQPLTVTDV